MAPINRTPVVGEVLMFRPGGVYSTSAVEVRVIKVWPAVCEVESTSGVVLKYQKPGRGLRVSVAQLYK